MEEQNKNIENQQPENENNETAIQTKKPIPKKTIIIASIVAAVAIIATIVCIIAFGKSSEEKAIVGEWYCTDFGNMCVKFLKDNTGELFLSSDTIMDFEWKYDKEKENYCANIGGYRMTFEFRTEAGITFLDCSGFGYFFKEEDYEVALSKADIIRNNIIDEALGDKILITVGQTIFEGDFSIVINSVQMNEFIVSTNDSITCNVSITANRDVTSDELNALITFVRYYYVDMNFLPTSSTTNAKIKLADVGLSAGETLSVDFNMRFNNLDLSSTVKEWGLFHGYGIFTIGDTEYRLDLREYTKQ